jgi:hypothetical protein
VRIPQQVVAVVAGDRNALGAAHTHHGLKALFARERAREVHDLRGRLGDGREGDGKERRGETYFVEKRYRSFEEIWKG